MFLGIPAWTLMLPLAAMKPFDGESLAQFPVASALTLYILFTVMNLMPKIAGLIDIMLTPGGRCSNWAIARRTASTSRAMPRMRASSRKRSSS
jgi:membrane glycosyltransferase